MGRSRTGREGGRERGEKDTLHRVNARLGGAGSAWKPERCRKERQEEKL